MTSAREVAAFFIALAQQRGLEVNNLKLQKLLYYAQAWHLGLFGDALFPEKFQAWSTGPVIPEVYRQFKPFGIQPIGLAAELPVFDDELSGFLLDVVEEYMPLDEYDLASLTYREAPFQNARAGVDLSEPCEEELSESDMRAYFGRLSVAA